MNASQTEIEQSHHLSPHGRVSLTPDGIVIGTRAEAGRGKRFGTTGQVELDADETVELTRYLLANIDMRAVLEYGRKD